MKKRRTIQKTPNQHWEHLIPCVGLAVLALIAYWNSFDVPFQFDDEASIIRNYGVRFSWANWDLRQFLRPRMLLLLTFRLDSWFGGVVVWHYHLLNLLLHVANTILVLYIARHIFRQVLAEGHSVRMYSFLAASFFALHPVQTQAVTYISSRSELLSTFFYASAFLLFIKWPAERIGFLLSLVIGFLFLLALGGKETVITLPAVLILYDYLFIARLSLRSVVSRWRCYGTFVAGGLAVIIYLFPRTLGSAIGAPGSPDPWHYFLTQFTVIVRYVQLIFLPVGLNLDYDFPIYKEFWNPAVILSACLLGMLILSGWLLRRTQPIVSFAIFWFFITLSPTSSFFPVPDVIFEHRLYLPLVAVSLLFPIAVNALSKILSRFGFTVRTAQIAITMLVVLGVGTVLRNQVWRSEITLWEDIISKSPGKPRPYYSLMYAHFKKQDYQKAIAVAQMAQQRLPDDMWQVNNSLGNMYLQLGQYEAAARVFAENVPIDPTGGLSANNLGTTYRYMIGELDRRKGLIPTQEFESQRRSLLNKAQEAFEAAIHRSPDNLDFFDAYVNAAFDNGRAVELEARFQEQVEKEETFNPLYGIGKIKMLGRDMRTAIEYFERANSLKVERLLSFNMGNAWSELGEFDKSIASYQSALKADTMLKEAYYNLGSVYMRVSNLDSAIQQFSEVLRIDPNHIFTHIMMARVYIQKSDRAAALQHLDKVLTLSPGHQEAQALRSSLRDDRRRLWRRY